MKLTRDINWLYNEFKQVGMDYSSPEEVARYEQRHSDFRDLAGECREVLDFLDVGADDTLLDMGAGTGFFARQAALRCKQVHAVDVSRAMLDHASSRAREQGLTNIEFHEGGFLTYAHQGRPVDIITTTYAFHHLPDFWKGVALTRMHDMLSPGGRLYMRDVIMTPDNAVEHIQAFIDELGRAGDDFMREEVEQHFSDEYSTFDWVMDGLFERAGFRILSKEIQGGVTGIYLCGRP